MLGLSQTVKNDLRLFPKPLQEWRPNRATATPQGGSTSTQRIEFEGQIHEFPADFTDDDIAQALDSFSPYEPPAPSPLMQGALNDMSDMTTRFDKRPTDAVRDSAYIGQRANRGIADVVGAPVDLMTGALNIGAFGADKLAELFGGNMDYRITNPVMGSDWIADRTSKGYEALGGEVVDNDDVSPIARIVGEAGRFAVGAALPSAGLASKTGQALAQAEGPARRVLAPLAAPYRNSPSPMVGDAVAGAGSGAALAAYEDDMPDNVKDMLGPIGPVAAALLGGTASATGHSLASGATDLAKNAGRNIVSGSGDPNAPINPTTGKRAFSRSEMDEAARAVQAQATNPRTAVANIGDNTEALAGVARPGEMPTAGAISEDTGLALLEREMRSRNAKPFTERDQAVNSRASAIMRENAPAGSTGRDFTESADAMQRDRMSAAQANVDAARKLEEGSTDALRQMAAPVSAGRGQGVQSSQKLDEALTGGSLRPMQAKKNEAFAAIDPDRSVIRDAQPLVDAAQSIRDSLGRLNDPSSILPTRTLDRISALAEDAGGAGTITFDEINALRPELSSALVKAQATGDFALADNIKKLQSAVNRETDMLAAEGTAAGKRAANAKRIYQEEFAPVWNPGPGDEATRFRRDFNADREGRTLSPPSATASRFLKPGQPEKAASLQRIIETVPDKATAYSQARSYLISDLAESGALDAKSQMLRYDSLRKWRDQWGDALDVAPGLKSEIDTLIQNVSKGTAVQAKFMADLRAAETRLDDAAKNRGALGLVLGKDPHNAVGSIFKAGDPEAAMNGVVKEVGKNAQAIDGLKAAVADYIIDKTSSAALQKTTDGTRPIDFAKLENLFNRHENTLAAVYTPAEMNALRQAHKLLKPQNATKLSGGGVSLTDTQKSEQAWRLLEGGLKARYGVLKGGGVLRTMRIFVSALPNRDEAMREIILRMHFDSELATHLLGRNVPVDTPQWNAKLNRLLAYATGARDSTDGGSEEKRGRIEITVDKATGERE